MRDNLQSLLSLRPGEYSKAPLPCPQCGNLLRLVTDFALGILGAIAKSLVCHSCGYYSPLYPMGEKEEK